MELFFFYKSQIDSTIITIARSLEGNIEINSIYQCNIKNEQ